MIDGAGWAAAGQFYLAMTLLAFAALPLAAFLRPGAIGGPWAIARCAAMPFIAWAAWLLSDAGLPWGGAALVGGIATLAALSLLCVCLSPRVRRALRGVGGLWRAELFYLVLFVIVLTIRAWNADLYGLEKFMNIAFVNSIYHAPALPAADPWLAGMTINYYYFGHVTVALASLMSGQPTDIGTNLMFAHVFAATGLAAAMVIMAIARRAGATRGLARLIAETGSVVLVLGGNLHTVVYGVIRPALAAFGLAEPWDYFYPQSSRLIGHQPLTNDKTITEFPGYSITVGDLHAHVMNLPVAVTLLFLIVALAMGRRAGWPALGQGASAARRAHGLAHAVALIVLIGISSMANSWDVPIYLTLFGVAAIAVLRSGGMGFIPASLQAGVLGIVLLIAGLAVAFPFWRDFTPFSQGIRWTIYGSTGWQLFLLYGNYALVAVVAFAAASGATPVAPAGRARSLRAIAALLIAVAVVLSVPEFVYVKDLYGDDNSRANTMFKLSYQAFLMLPIAAFAGTAIALTALTRTLPRLGMASLATLFAVSPIVFVVLVHGPGFFGMMRDPQHIDGLRFLKNGDREAAIWLETHRPPPGEIMLEASGDSFTYAARLSAVTGIPTILGWHAHEWLWRDSLEAWQGRSNEIGDFYQTMDPVARRDFVRRWRIRYVVIGDFERERYAGLDVAGVTALGRVAFEAGGTQIVEIAP